MKVQPSIRFPVLSAEPSIREKECNEVDNKRIITMMNIEFSDIYLSKT